MILIFSLRPPPFIFILRKMKLFVVFACIFISAPALPAHDTPRGTWGKWKGEHGKNYSDTVEDIFRMSIFLDNVAIIKAHNEMAERGEMSYDMGTNEFSDLVSVARNKHVI